jgi:hypothetical protein
MIKKEGQPFDKLRVDGGGARMIEKFQHCTLESFEIVI